MFCQILFQNWMKVCWQLKTTIQATYVLKNIGLMWCVTLKKAAQERGNCFKGPWSPDVHINDLTYKLWFRFLFLLSQTIRVTNISFENFTTKVTYKHFICFFFLQISLCNYEQIFRLSENSAILRYFIFLGNKKVLKLTCFYLSLSPPEIT